MTMKRPHTWSEKTKFNLTLGALITLIATSAGVSWHAANVFGKVEARLESVEKAAQESWSYPMHREWSDKLKIANPTLHLPDVGAIRKDHIEANLGPRPTSLDGANPIASTLDVCDPFPVENVP